MTKPKALELVRQIQQTWQFKLSDPDADWWAEDFLPYTVAQIQRAIQALVRDPDRKHWRRPTPADFLQKLAIEDAGRFYRAPPAVSKCGVCRDSGWFSIPVRTQLGIYDFRCPCKKCDIGQAIIEANAPLSSEYLTFRAEAWDWITEQAGFANNVKGGIWALYEQIRAEYRKTGESFPEMLIKPGEEAAVAKLEEEMRKLIAEPDAKDEKARVKGNIEQAVLDYAASKSKESK